VARYIAVSLVRGLLTLFAVSVIIFSLARITGDPLDVLAPVDMSREDEEALAAKWGLDKPLPQQYFSYVGNALQGDFGDSFIFPTETASGVILDRLPRTLQLGAVSLVLTIVIGVPLGVLAAVRRGTWMDSFARGFALFGQSIPNFWFGIVLIWIFAAKLQWLPTSGQSDWKSYILPSLVVSIFGMAAMVRLFRSSMLETLDSEFVKLARLKGVSRLKVIWKHALKAASIAPLTFFGQIFIRIVTGATVAEIVFAWPGVGLLAYEAANARDFPVVQTLALYTSSVIVFVNLAIDIIYAKIDPRVRLGETALS
jgi:peptide/nickel transport system permease protein